MAAQTADPAQTSVGRCIDAIRQLILTGALLPGETIRQGRLAGLPGTSRIPDREALTTLQAEGVVTCTPRGGHAVARFSPAEFAQHGMTKEHELNHFTRRLLTPAGGTSA